MLPVTGLARRLARVSSALFVVALLTTAVGCGASKKKIASAEDVQGPASDEPPPRWESAGETAPPEKPTTPPVADAEPAKPGKPGAPAPKAATSGASPAAAAASPKGAAKDSLKAARDAGKAAGARALAERAAMKEAKEAKEGKARGGGARADSLSARPSASVGVAAPTPAAPAPPPAAAATAPAATAAAPAKSARAETTSASGPLVPDDQLLAPVMAATTRAAPPKIRTEEPRSEPVTERPREEPAPARYEPPPPRRAPLDDPPPRRAPVDDPPSRRGSSEDSRRSLSDGPSRRPSYDDADRLPAPAPGDLQGLIAGKRVAFRRGLILGNRRHGYALQAFESTSTVFKGAELDVRIDGELVRGRPIPVTVIFLQISDEKAENGVRELECQGRGDVIFDTLPQLPKKFVRDETEAGDARIDLAVRVICSRTSRDVGALTVEGKVTSRVLVTPPDL